MSSPSEDDPRSPAQPEEKQLCINCMAPNDPSAHFCAKCGTPLTSYASTGPFESVFAEGAVYRQAAERPRSLIILLGIWLIFGMTALAGAVLLFLGREMGIGYTIAGAFFFPVSLIMIWKTTRNYLAQRSKRNQ